RALRPAGAERAHPQPAALDRGAARRARPARRVRRRHGRDDPRRRQLRPRLGLDRVDGRGPRRRPRRRAAPRLGRGDLGREQDRHRRGRSDDGGGRRRDLRARREAARAAGAGARAVHRRVRETWVQPEDLIGHEFRQSREEGKDVDELEARWLAAGGAPAPARGASPDPAPPELRALALELLDEAAAIPRPLAAEEPEALDEILACANVAEAGFEADRGRIRSAWLGRAVGCVLGKPVENIPREGIRAIAQSTANWPVSHWFTAEGLDPAVAERWPWNRASRPTSLAENID